MKVYDEKYKRSTLLLSLFLVMIPVWAGSSIAVTDFELLNLTLKLTDPKKVAEIDTQDQKNIAMINDLLKEALAIWMVSP